MVRVLPPSECAVFGPDELIKVGGRVTFIGPEHWVLADAFSHLTLAVQGVVSGASCAVGELAQLTLERKNNQFWLRNVDHVSSGLEPSASTEFGRRAMSPRAQQLRARSRAKRAIHAYFEGQQFVEVDTPSVVPCPGLDAHVASWGAVAHRDRELFLITSPEFHMKRLLASGLPNIYQLSHCFRAEELGAWHQPEFMMLEWYRAFSDWEATMSDTEEVLRASAQAIAHESTQQLLESPFERITVSEAFATFGGEPDALDLAQVDENRYFEVLVDRVEPALSCYPRPLFLTHYPITQAALAKPSARDPQAAERYELYFRGQELCNGYTELTDAQVQRERFTQELARRTRTGEPLYPIDERFMSALREGLPPCSGNALGFDRMVATLLDLQRLGSVMAFTDDEV